MESALQPHTIVKSALFVDFDNIYIGLSKTDPLAAERFASDPARWLAWLEKGLPGIPPDSGGSPLRRRSILIRRCYPNPDAGFRRYRSFFTSAAFSVIDTRSTHGNDSHSRCAFSAASMAIFTSASPAMW